jgi:membrane protease YdiL (CAAX protease family)
MVYAAFGIYIAVAMPLHLFDFSTYVEMLTSTTRNTTIRMPGTDVERLAWIYALIQIPLAYIYAITINAFIALGEEIGWRGYLYKLLGK